MPQNSTDIFSCPNLIHKWHQYQLLSILVCRLLEWISPVQQNWCSNLRYYACPAYLPALSTWLKCLRTCEGSSLLPSTFKLYLLYAASFLSSVSSRLHATFFAHLTVWLNGPTGSRRMIPKLLSRLVSETNVLCKLHACVHIPSENKIFCQFSKRQCPKSEWQM